MTKVKFEEATKKFGNVVAVDGVSFEAREGEFLVLVGPSGCGKSTTLRCLAGLEEVDKGKMYIGDECVNDLPPKDRGIAMVFQNYALYPHMNVYENMSFSLRLKKIPKEEIDKRVHETARLLKIEDLLDRKPKELSGGQRQRVALGRAIVRDPKIFLFDEPLSNLDAKLRVQTRTELVKLHQKLKTTSIYVTHDQAEAMIMGTRIIVLKDGKIQQIDTPQDLYDHPKSRFVAEFIGSPPMNFLDATVIERDNALYLDTEWFVVAVLPKFKDPLKKYINREVTLGIRPEDIHDAEFVSTKFKSNIIEAKVEVKESLGSTVFLHLKNAEKKLVAKVDQRTKAEVGEVISLVLDVSKIHVFDKNSEKAIF